ncbi:MAG: right-handed parallel beta-helix repeat-containing protein, partial [Planctomycetota bacterium]|nr:right-handed parallel beta-helix repeat-containing protein [Planctomycetota bacterium]
AGDDVPNFTNPTDNSSHVTNAAGTTARADVEGFTGTAGAATGGGGSNDRGGGILALSGTAPTLIDCAFVGNRCTFGGGAGYVNGAPSFIRCSFEDNLGGSFGGAFDIAGAGPISLDQCTFERNRASRAGAVEVFSTSAARITNCFFKDNVATGGGGGGGLWFGGGGSSLVANCTVVENQANTQAQGGIRVQGAAPQIVNCVIWDNTGSGGATGSSNQVTASANVDHCLVTGGFAGGVGNIGAAPSFADAAGGDYSLAAGSAGIDAGDSGALPATLLVDLAGRGRLRDDPATPDTGVIGGQVAVVDMGAYEFQAGAVGISFCLNSANSTGSAALLTGQGSEVAADDDITLTATGLPANRVVLLAVSASVDSIPFAGGSQGTLCLGGAIGRFNGQVANSGATGSVDLPLDLTSIPVPGGPAAAMAGDTWIFQAWYQDTIFGIPVSNFTSALRVELQ